MELVAALKKTGHLLVYLNGLESLLHVLVLLDSLVFTYVMEVAPSMVV